MAELLQEKLYKTVIKEKVLSTKVLNNNGINSRDINKLIEQGELVRIKRGVYDLPNVEKLYYYAKGLHYDKKYEEAHKYFVKCHELVPKHGGACFQLFFWDIEHENYEEAIKYVDTLLTTNNKYYLNDINYYLYLLSFVTKIPIHLQKRVKNFTSEDFIIYYDDKRYKNFKEHTKSRKIAFSQSFSNSARVFNDLISSNGKINQMELLERILLYKVIQTKREIRDKRMKYLQDKDYELLLKDLNNESFNHELSKINKYLVTLLLEYLDIKRTNKVPKSYNISSKELLSKDAMFCAIEYKNYPLALKLSSKYNENLGIQNNGFIQAILSDMVDLIEKIEEKSKPTPKAIDSTLVLSKILNNLIEEKVENAIDELHNYLVSIGKEKYEFLIVDLMKISILEKDYTFSKPMLTLTNINNDKFTFDTLSYVQEFYEKISKNSFEVARIYLDIINKSKEFGTPLELMESLNKTLELLDKKHQEKVVEQKQQEIEDITTDPDYIFLNEKMNQLTNKKELIILEPMDRVQRKKIHKLVEKFPNMGSFSIGEDKERRIVLRYVNPEWIDLEEVKSNLSRAQKTKNYKKCAECQEIIVSMPKAKEINFYRLGIYYNKLGLYKESIDYLVVAYELFKQNPHKKDESAQMALLDLINKTKVKIEEYETKKEVGVPIKKQVKQPIKKTPVNKQNNKNGTNVSQSLDEYFGITKIDDISIMVNDMGMSITEACNNCGLTEEDAYIVRLIYARDCYSQGNFEKGDSLFKIVERSKNKSPRLKKVIEEVRLNKPFYIHRQEKGKQLLKNLKFKN